MTSSCANVQSHVRAACARLQLGINSARNMTHLLAKLSSCFTCVYLRLHRVRVNCFCVHSCFITMFSAHICCMREHHNITTQNLPQFVQIILGTLTFIREVFKNKRTLVAKWTFLRTLPLRFRVLKKFKKVQVTVNDDILPTYLLQTDILSIEGRLSYFVFGSRQLIVTKVDERAGAKKSKAYDSGIMSLTHPLNCVYTSEVQILTHKCNTNTQDKNSAHTTD